MLLLVASCYFYMSFVYQYILILAFTTIVDYIAGILIEKSEGRKRKAWLIASIIANVGVLVFYKYFNFLVDNINDTLHLFDSSREIPYLNIILPIGLSFHTFQAMSYTIEVYWRKQKAEYHFPTYALYVMFYPQLVAGPIERPQNILPQLQQYKGYDINNIREGISRMLWGYFKKVVIADRLALAVDHIFANSEQTSWVGLCVGGILYSFQIYCDFSGYSDIGIGAARVMNIKLMENFKQPYLAPNITSFWSRWHISLSSWFRDYVYIPLGGNRKGETKRKRNIFVVFLLSGFWHGANWTFGIWGFLHGVLATFLPGKKVAPSKLKFGRNAINILATFCVVALLWIFFRAENIGHAWQYITGIFTLQDGSYNIGINITELWFSFFVIGVMLWREYKLPEHKINSRSKYIVYVSGMIAVLYFFGVFEENQFIYFQF
ncbi:MAG: MBOAT family protein [Chitinophagaceae bacterium]|nr:MBOAT family protein [Chitinophagaceae bacterium]